ncbi:MAG: PQQ-dependent sugar dehydrogenase [Pyrinomonadaceae bacterium MAG19_C2-C3]|nr:PQQ-dependent sugar dehydrogenase [Pyrinomonadaceae bacterium MAG19_C2-C3]
MKNTRHKFSPHLRRAHVYQSRLWFASLMFIVALTAFVQNGDAQTLPSNYEDSLVTGVIAPTALAFTPDGRLLITTQGGQVRVFQNNALLATPALNLNARLCANSERGLLGVAVDPNFTQNRFVYFYYTFNKNNQCPTGQPTNPNNPVNRVARFVLNDDNTINLTSEMVLIDNIHSPAGNHNGGDLHFGKDGLLYISVGDGGADYAGDSGGAGANDAARDRHVLLGKILRVTRDGDIPADNPYRGADSGRCNVTGSTTAGNWCQETFASGLRNPFRIAFDPNAAATRFFINDVGQNVWEEIDEGARGADYGWNLREGHCANGSTTNCGTVAGLVNPVFDYPRVGSCGADGVCGNSITGGAFVPAGVWSQDFDGAYLFSDFVAGKIFKLTRNSNGTYTGSTFVSGLGNSSAVTLIFGADGNLYYTTYAGGGQVRRIRFTGTANRAPVASATANPSSGSAPLTVNFNASASTDPDGDALTFAWDFGDGTSGAGVIVSHTYTQIGTYNATLTVTDGRGGSNTTTVRIDAGNTAPQPTIIAPTTDKLFRVGETITLTGSATDAQDGTLTANRLTWQVLLHHNNDHTHPYLPPTTGNNITFTAPAPEDLPAATGSFLEIRLTATDAQGLTTTVVQNLQPRKVNVTLGTLPDNFRVLVNRVLLTANSTLVSWEGYDLNVEVGITNNAGRQIFQAWSDGNLDSRRTITTPASDVTYTALYIPFTFTYGVTADYFDNVDLTGTRVRRIDAAIAWDWGTNAPLPGIGSETFSVRWTGMIAPRFNETYTFYTQTDDGVRLRINGVLLIDDWNDHALKENSASVQLIAGRNYYIQMEYYDRSGAATARLLWSSPSQPKQIVPSARLAARKGRTARGVRATPPFTDKRRNK